MSVTMWRYGQSQYVVKDAAGVIVAGPFNSARSALAAWKRLGGKTLTSA